MLVVKPFLLAFFYNFCYNNPNMNVPLLRRILAIISLVAIICATVFGMLCFFNQFNWVFGTIATICLGVTAVFGIPVYVLRPKEPTDLGKLPEGEADEGDEGSTPAESETEHGENDVNPDNDVVPDSEGDKKGKAE